MSDAKLRELERKAYQGDPQAGGKLVKLRRRLGLPGAFPGEYVSLYTDRRIRWVSESRLVSLKNFQYTELNMMSVIRDEEYFDWTLDFFVVSVVGFDATERDARKYLRSLLGRR